MAEILSHRCLFCGREDVLADGLLLLGRSICGDCEKNIVNSGCCDLVYSFYINGLKKIWRCAGI